MKEKRGKKKKKKKSHDKQNNYQCHGKKITKLSRVVLDAGEGGKKKKKEIYPDDLTEMPNERQSAVLSTHKSLKHIYLNHQKLKLTCSNLIIPAL